MTPIKSIDFYGLKVSVFSIVSLEEYIKNCILKSHKIICYGYGLATIALMKECPEIFLYGQKSDVIVTDGRPFYILLKMLGFPLIDDLSIPNMVNLVLDLCDRNGFSVMLIGANTETNCKATENIKNRYINLKIYPGINGYFNEEDELKIVEQINYNSPDVILIGISSPKKEILANKWKEQCNAKVFIPCGGMIDVYAGVTKQTPNIIKKIGLASIYRIIQEPKRLLKRNLNIYIFSLFKFLPALIFSTVLLKKKNFNIPSFCKIS